MVNAVLVASEEVPSLSVDFQIPGVVSKSFGGISFRIDGVGKKADFRIFLKRLVNRFKLMGHFWANGGA